jgi:hypothetical protein
MGAALRPLNGGRFFDALGLSVQAADRLVEVTGPWIFYSRNLRI